MQTNITVPTNIKSQMKLSIGRWFKKVGDPVTLDEPLVEIDSDNGTHEIRATATGVLSQILLKDGAFVEPNAPLGIIAEY
jgi:pyruvate/2-oxoglutarate dehydrogenase complex dihydrolipoamide acyltransferase (E2) component